MRNPWEVLRNPDLRLNAHYYITKVTGLEIDVVFLVFIDKYVINSIFAMLLSKLEKRDWLVACMISREAATAA